MKRHSLERDKAILMIIDLQEKLMKAMDMAKLVYKNTKIMLALADQLKIPVMVNEQYPKGLGRTVQDIAGHLGEHMLFEKTTFSAVTDEILGQIRPLKRTQILMVGSETHVCVFQTARDLVSEGFEVFVLRDGICSRHKRNHINGLQLMRDGGAVITDTETAVFDLLKVAGTPEFKAIQQLLK